MKPLFTILALIITFATSCTTNTPTQNFSQWDTIDKTGQHLKLETIKVDSGWGYTIFADNQKLITQKHIPAISGNYTFNTQQDAYNCGHLVITKIINNQMPPSITFDDLKNLKIIK